MAFDACAMMSAMCEGPCGVLSYVVVPPLTLQGPASVTRVVPALEVSGVQATNGTLEPPPKSLRFSA